MKVLAAVISICFLAFSVLPCADSVTHFSWDIVDVPTPDSGDTIPQDTISSLCTCSCCHTHVEYEEAHFFTTIESSVTVYNCLYQGRVTTSYTHPPLRPPQV